MVVVYLLGLILHRLVLLQLYKWLKTLDTFLIVDRWISGFLSLQQTDIYKYIQTQNTYIHTYIHTYLYYSSFLREDLLNPKMNKS